VEGSGPLDWFHGVRYSVTRQVRHGCLWWTVLVRLVLLVPFNRLLGVVTALRRHAEERRIRLHGSIVRLAVRSPTYNNNIITTMRRRIALSTGKFVYVYKVKLIYLPYRPLFAENYAG